jgi:NAD(P)-dependent dehydrogenase (short-subunit alcohol dehydrogenase family)
MQSSVFLRVFLFALFTSETTYAMSVPGGMRCIVTGGSSGIGAAVCSELGRRGARVFITGRQEETMQKVKKEVEKEGGSAAYGVGDVRSETDVKRLYRYRRASSPFPP